MRPDPNFLQIKKVANFDKNFESLETLLETLILPTDKFLRVPVVVATAVVADLAVDVVFVDVVVVFVDAVVVVVVGVMAETKKD